MRPVPCCWRSTSTLLGVLAAAAVTSCGSGTVGDGQVQAGDGDVRRYCPESGDPCNPARRQGQRCVLQAAPDGTPCPEGICIHGQCVAPQAGPDAGGAPDAAASAPDAGPVAGPDAGSSGVADAGELPQGCRVANGANVSTPFAAQSGKFEIQWDVTPAATNLDSAVGVSKGAVSGGIAFPTTVRFFVDGTIDARDGGAYGKLVSIQYAAGTTYRVRQIVDLAAHTYTVYVRAAGAAELLLAQDYAFRTGFESLADVDTWIVGANSGQLTACLVSLQPAGVSVRISPATVTLAPQATQQFTAQVTGAANPGVSWSVVGTGCGSITTGGLYTAPASGASCKVRATSLQDSQAFAEASVTVRTVNPNVGDMGALAAFPGAQGGGAASKGGRGGTVYVVNTLADGSGSGCGPNGVGTCTLRNCVNASGPRTCVFAVAGKIDLTDGLYVNNPYLTVAGQTAPGSGIQLTMSTRCTEVFTAQTHDVVVQYVRFRKGWPGSYNECGGNMSARPRSGTSGVDVLYNVVYDHCSIEWNQGMGIGIWSWGGSSYSSTYSIPNAITFSWNLIAEGIYPHAVAVLSGSDGDQTLSQRMVDMDLHHSLIATFNHRMPLFKHGRGRVVSNIIYNPAFYYTSIAGGGSFDLIGNVYRPGPRRVPVHGIHLAKQNATTAPGIPDVYVHNNYDEQFNPDPTVSDAAQWANMVRFTDFENGGSGDERTDGTAIFGSNPVRRTTRLVAPTRSGIEIEAVPLTTPADLESVLLPDVGASKRLDCEGRLVNARDSLDARFITEYQTRTGKQPWHPCFCQPGQCTYSGNPVTCNDGIDPISALDWPAVSAGTRCPDGDSDGMPDSWESDHGLNPASAADGGALRANGYSNLEHFLSGRVPNGTALP